MANQLQYQFQIPLLKSVLARTLSAKLIYTMQNLNYQVCLD